MHYVQHMKNYLHLLASKKYKVIKIYILHLFQISNKFRDEDHPEYGLIRKKNFIWLMHIVLMLMKVD